jgi:predicted Fe-Mo cluster-binding NifX family protein
VSARDSIAVGVDDRGQIWSGHFGVAPYYRIYDRTGQSVERRLNPYGPNGDQHAHHGNPALVAELLPECSVFVGRQMGNKECLAKELGITPVVTGESDPDLAVRALLTGEM